MKINVNHGKRLFVVYVEQTTNKYISITVHPDLQITAKVPTGFDKIVVVRRLKKRAPWIAKQIDYFTEFHPLAVERQYVSGETHYYLGRQYRLKINKASDANVKLRSGFFVMELPDPHDNKQAKEIMQQWYDDHAVCIFKKRIAHYLPKFLKAKAEAPMIKFRKMKKRWGSFSKKGTITFNLDLIKTPAHCIDYVIVHEFCHLWCPHHDVKFFRLLEKTLPCWKESKKRLEQSSVI